MITSIKASKSILYVSLLTFISFILYILYINQEVLYTAHSRSEFLFGASFFRTLMSKPFGLMQYVGGWLTQFFYKPVVGASLLVSIWILIYWVGTRAFRLQGSAVALMLLPIACLLTSVVDLGYWIYTFTIRGYWFSQSVAYLIILVLLWTARCTPRRWHLVWYLAAVCTYPLLGWFSLLFVVCLALSDKLSWRELLAIILLVFTANIWRELLYSNQKLDDVLMAGMPRLATPSDTTPYLTTPFWVLGAISILLALCGRYLTQIFVPVLCAVAGMLFTWSFMFQDSNYIDEMRIVRNAENDNWDEVLHIVEPNSDPTVSMVILKNIALMNEGGLLESSFKTSNDGRNIYNPDSLHVSFLNIAAPVAYYNYGLINEGFRLGFECAVQTGFSPFYLKNLARSAYANGEEELVRRYVDLLHHHPYYRDWQPAPASANVRELHDSYPDEITGVENSDSYIVNTISLWYSAEGKVASEQALFYSMIRCEPLCFWPALRNYIRYHQNETFWVHAQEAYIMFIDRHPEEKRMLLPVSEDIYDRYQQFWGKLQYLMSSDVDKNEIPDMMRKDYGDTYWYYNIFKRRKY